MIEDLVQKSAIHAGLSPEQASTALSAALFLIRKHGDPAKVNELFQAVPGSEAMAEAGSTLATKKGGGLVSGMMRNAAGASGAAMSDAMAMGQQMARQGVTTSDMQKILPLAMGWVHEKSGRDLLREVLATVPGLGPLLMS